MSSCVTTAVTQSRWPSFTHQRREVLVIANHCAVVCWKYWFRTQYQCCWCPVSTVVGIKSGTVYHPNPVCLPSEIQLIIQISSACTGLVGMKWHRYISNFPVFKCDRYLSNLFSLWHFEHGHCFLFWHVTQIKCREDFSWIPTRNWKRLPGHGWRWLSSSFTISHWLNSQLGWESVTLEADGCECCCTLLAFKLMVNDANKLSCRYELFSVAPTNDCKWIMQLLIGIAKFCRCQRALGTVTWWCVDARLQSAAAAT